MEQGPRLYPYDYEICDGEMSLQRTIEFINEHGYSLVSVTQYEDKYTVFFRRPLYG